MDLKNIFSSMPKRFKAEKAGDYQTIFHFDLEDKKTKEHFQYTVIIENGKCEVKEGLEGEAKCVVKTKPKHYIALNLGTLNAQTAFMTGKVKVSNLGELMKFIPLFSRYKTETTSEESEEKTKK